MIQCSIIKFCFILFLIKYCYSNKCNYTIIKSDNTSDECISNQCNQFINLLSLIVKSKTCKTSILSLSFSTYKKFLFFRNQFKWRIGDLFYSKSFNKDRQFNLFIDKIDLNDKPFDYNQIIQLGINIDYYYLFIRNISKQNYLYNLIHFDPKNPEWNIIQIKFRCIQLSGFDNHPCSSEIISPPLLSPERPVKLVQSTVNIIDLTSTSSTEKFLTKSKEENKSSTHLILIIIIPILIILITIFIFILIYLYINEKYCFNRKVITNSQSSSRTNSLNNPISNERISLSSSIFDNTIIQENGLNIEHMQNSPICNDCHRHANIQSRNNSSRVTSDKISIIGKQYFVPISSSINF